jgi:hypothetical protein
LFAGFAVVDFVMVAPPSFNTFQQKSTAGLQLTQQQSLEIIAFHQISPRTGIWFGNQVLGAKVVSINVAFSID